MHIKRHQREAFFGHSLGQPPNFIAIQQQLAWSHWVVGTHAVAEFICRNVHVL